MALDEALQAALPVLKGRKILVVDDNAVSRDLIEPLCTASGGWTW